MTQARWNQVVRLGLSLAFMLALGVVDYLTTAELDLFLFYSIPVAITAWVAGRWPAVGTALLALGTWGTGPLVWATPYSSTFYTIWNTTLRGGWILLVALAVSRICSDLARERRLNADLVQAHGQVRELESLLPICAWCKKVRNDQGYWEQLETYLRRTARTEITHGICPACTARLQQEGARPT